jgi:hypothetical protein
LQTKYPDAFNTISEGICAWRGVRGNVEIRVGVGLDVCVGLAVGLSDGVAVTVAVGVRVCLGVAVVASTM